MAYPYGTYVAFHAGGNNIPGEKSDLDYYKLMVAWDAQKSHRFYMVDSREKASTVRRPSKKNALRAYIQECLENSKNMVLIVSKNTRFEREWMSFEIETAIDGYRLPIIVAYTMLGAPIRNARALVGLWPAALRTRIGNGAASAIHVPFKRAPIYEAIGIFSPEYLPVGGGLTVYAKRAYEHWKIS